MRLQDDLVVKVVEIKDEVKASEIALQAWNIKRELDRKQDGSHFDLIFLEGTNRLRVKYTDTGNLDNVINSWGEVISEESELHMVVDVMDMKDSVAQEIDEQYVFLNIEGMEAGMTGDVTISFVE